MTRPKHLITFLMLTVALFAGCGCDRAELLPDTIEKPTETIEKPDEPVEPPTEPEPVDPVNEETVDGETDPEPLGDLPTAFPPSLLPEYSDVWQIILEAGENDPEYMMSLVPDDPDIASNYLYAFGEHNLFSEHDEIRISYAFEIAYAKALIEKFPNNIPVLRKAVMVLPRGTHASREELLYFIEIWERIKRLNDEQNVPFTSGWRMTSYLTHAYIYVGELDKARENYDEEVARIVALEESGVDIHPAVLNNAGIMDPFVMRALGLW